MARPVVYCPSCGRLVISAKRGRVRRYCNDACRQKAARRRAKARH